MVDVKAKKPDFGFLTCHLPFTGKMNPVGDDMFRVISRYGQGPKQERSQLCGW